MGVKLGPSR